MSGLLHSSIARKVAMAISALFLILFLILHLTINLVSVISENAFNEYSHFMGTNPLIQFLMQPILVLGVVFHFVMGFVLEYKNQKARNVKYVKYAGSNNSTWMSRNMIYTGLVVLAFIVLHFIDFWFPEMNYKYIQFNPEDPTRYYSELVHKFQSPLRTGAYIVAFVFLALHLLHGFQSAFQSIGFNNKYTSLIKKLGKCYAIVIPIGFIFVALFHHFISSH